MSNVLVAYFSASGTTARAAQSLAKAAGADSVLNTENPANR